MRIEVVQQGAVVHTVQWSQGALTVGRAPDNDLILRDPDVSGHHLLLFHEGGAVRARDLGSTNGSFVNGERFVETRLRAEDQLSLGGLTLRFVPMGLVPERSWLLRQADQVVAHPIESGASLDDHPEAVIFVEDDGLWLDMGGEGQRLTPGERFAIGDRSYLVEPGDQIAPTVRRTDGFPYRLHVDLDAPVALLSHGELEVDYRSVGRVSLLFVLARQVGEWVDDQTIGTGVWGRDWTRQGANNLNVLIHRVRKKAEIAGFDRRFVERRRGGARLVLAHATVG